MKASVDQHPGEPSGWPSALGLWALVALSVASPWPFGSAHPLAVKTITIVALSTVTLVLAAQAVRGSVSLPSPFLWPVIGVVALGTSQLVPLPPAVHEALAPGSYQVWHPSAPAA